MKTKFFLSLFAFFSFVVLTCDIDGNKKQEIIPKPKYLTIKGLPEGTINIYIGVDADRDQHVACALAHLDGETTEVTVALKEYGDEYWEDSHPKWTGSGDFILYVNVYDDDTWAEENKTGYFYSDGDTISSDMSSGLKRYNFNDESPRTTVDLNEFAVPAKYVSAKIDPNGKGILLNISRFPENANYFQVVALKDDGFSDNIICYTEEYGNLPNEVLIPFISGMTKYNLDLQFYHNLKNEEENMIYMDSIEHELISIQGIDTHPIEGVGYLNLSLVNGILTLSTNPILNFSGIGMWEGYTYGVNISTAENYPYWSSNDETCWRYNLGESLTFDIQNDIDISNYVGTEIFIEWKYSFILNNMIYDYMCLVRTEKFELGQNITNNNLPVAEYGGIEHRFRE
jgi:hypothetical protein